MNFISILQEMAAVHLDDAVADLMIAGDIEKAVHQYITNIRAKGATIAKSSSATTKKLKEGRPPKSLKMSTEKLEQIPANAWDAFNDIYKEAVKEGQGGKTPERKQSKGTVVRTRSGEEIVVTSGQKQKVIKDDLAVKVLALIKELEAKIEKEDDIAKVKDFESHIKALRIMLEGLHATRTGRAVITDTDPKILQQRYKKIGDEFKKKNMGESQSINEVRINEYEQIVDAANELIKITKDPEEKARLCRIINTFSRRIGIKPKKIYIDDKVDENVKLNIYYGNKMMALMEAEEYEGRYFAENYYFSAFAKAFKKDCDTFGLELTEDLYKMIYGEDILIITEAIAHDQDFFEGIGDHNSHLLFEGYGFDEYLSEGVWDTIKDFGGVSLGKITKFLNKGAGWAKKLMETGAAFFLNTSITQLVVPAIAVAGTVVGGIKLINAIRKKAKQSPLSKEEQDKFKEAVRNNREEIRKYI